MIELNKIYNEDCLDVMARIPDEYIDLVVTDPPYLINYRTGHRKDKDHKFTKVIANDDNPDLVKKYIKECYRIMKNNTAMYMFCSFDKIEWFKAELQRFFTIKNIIIWEKNNHTAGDLEAQFGKQYEMIILANKGRRLFNGERLTDVWKFKRVSPETSVHQNQKPLELIKRCVIKHSDPGQIVFDGFMGSGTTAVACLDTDRRFVGAELDKEYFDIAEKRIKNNVTQLSLLDSEV